VTDASRPMHRAAVLALLVVAAACGAPQRSTSASASSVDPALPNAARSERGVEVMPAMWAPDAGDSQSGSICDGGACGEPELEVRGQAAPPPPAPASPEQQPDARVPDASGAPETPSSDAGSPSECASGDRRAATEQACLELGGECYALDDGSYCSRPVMDPCPVGFERVPDGEPCSTEDGCFVFDEGVNCAPA